MSYRWILFDADGTLYDYDRAESIALKASFEGIGRVYKPEYNGIYRNINSQLWDFFERGQINQNDLRIRRFEYLLLTIGLDDNPSELSNLYLKNLSEQTVLISNAEEILAELSNHCQFVIVTNGLKDVQRPRFMRSSIFHYFADVIISEEVGHAKPDPIFFDIVFKRINYPSKEDVLIVGDSLSSDIEGGNNYNIDVCWFNPQRLPSKEGVRIDYEIQKLDELYDIILNN